MAIIVLKGRARMISIELTGECSLWDKTDLIGDNVMNRDREEFLV